MTFLELVRAAVVESGIHDTGPATVVDQTGMFALFVGWVRQEWIEIQLACPCWGWMRQTVSFTTSADKSSYTATELGLSVRDFDLNMARSYSASVGVADETFLYPLQYNDWRLEYEIGTRQTGQPIAIATNQRTLYIGPVPNDEYVITVDYYKSVQTLTENTDVPEMPEMFHQIIVDGALLRYARKHDAPEIATVSAMKKAEMMSRLWASEGPVVNLEWEALA